MSVARLVIPDLADKVVLITGASTGIGAALARGFAGQGAKVAINYHSSESAARALLFEIEGGGGTAMLARGDVTKPEDCAAIVAATAERFGRIDGLINNAGLMLGRVPSLEARRGAYRRRHRPQRALGDFRHPRGKTLARAPGRLRDQHDLDRGAQRRRRRGGALRRGQGFRLHADARPCEGTDRRKDPGQRRRARRHRDAVSRSLQQRGSHGGHAQDDSARDASEPPRNASGPTCSSPRIC